MIQILDEDIVFNELQEDFCKNNQNPCCGKSPCVAPCGPPAPMLAACPATGDPDADPPYEGCDALDAGGGTPGSCKWVCVRFPGGFHLNFEEGCGYSAGANYPACPNPDNEYVCKNCPKDPIPCQVLVQPGPENPLGVAQPGTNYRQCKGACDPPPGGACNLAGAVRFSTCKYTPRFS